MSERKLVRTHINITHGQPALYIEPLGPDARVEIVNCRIIGGINMAEGWGDGAVHIEDCTFEREEPPGTLTPEYVVEIPALEKKA